VQAVQDVPEEVLERCEDAGDDDHLNTFWSRA
jgi:hypothetical protein